MNEHQEFLYELTLHERGIFYTEPKCELIKRPVAEKARTYKLLDGSNVGRQFINKCEILTIFRKIRGFSIFCTKEDDIPKMYALLELELDKIKHEAEIQLKDSNELLNVLKKFEEDN